MTPLVLAFSGRIGSGKSTLSSAVALRLAWPYASFGDYIRFAARARGLDQTSRKILQDLGAQLIEDGWESFCRSVLAQADWEPGQPLVIDGVRHAEAVDMLRQLVAPEHVVIVFVAVSDEVRAQHLRARGGNDRPLSHLESHSTEAQVQTALPYLADLRVDGAQPLETLVDEIVAYVLRHDAPP
jgi:adenylate kinase family enzyme